MAAVQFIGRDAVLEAYRLRDGYSWGLFSGRSLLHTGDGADELETFLKMLEPGGGGSLYTLKIYADQDSQTITDRTAANGSFSFKLTEPVQAPGGAALTGIDAIMNRLNEIEQRLDDPDDQDDQDESKTISGIIMGYLENPVKLAQIVAALRGIPVNTSQVDKNNSYMPTVNTVGAFGPVTDQDDQNKSVERLGAAIDTLEKQDPKIVDHLEKLASLSVSNPQLFRMLINQLEKL